MENGKMKKLAFSLTFFMRLAYERKKSRGYASINQRN